MKDETRIRFHVTDLLDVIENRAGRESLLFFGEKGNRSRLSSRSIMPRFLVSAHFGRLWIVVLLAVWGRALEKGSLD